MAGGAGIWLAPASAEDEPADAGRQQLRTDLKEARELEGDERRDAAKKIREDAREGTYGEQVEQRHERRGAHRAAFAALLPDEMQADLKKVKATEDPEDRKAMREDVRKKALDGGYGEKVKKAFTLLEENRKK